MPGRQPEPVRGGGAEVTRTAGAGHGDAWGWGGAPETTAPAGLEGFGGLHGPQLVLQDF